MKIIPSCTLLLTTTALTAAAAERNQRPNIIFFLVDDMGWQDTSLPFWKDTTDLNRKYHTPNMKRLAAIGTKFTDAYACPVSSPSRISLITGTNVAQHQVSNWTLNKNQATDSRSDSLTFGHWNYNGTSPVPGIENAFYATPLAQVFKDNGYTTLFVGKAHFGALDTPAEDPLTLGFERNIAGHAAGAMGSYLGEENYGNHPAGSYTAPWGVPNLEKYHGSDTFLTEALTLEAAKLIDSSASVGKPFFLYMGHYAVHAPYKADKRFIQKYRDRGLSETEAQYAAIVEGMDKSLGDILDFLQKRPEVASNTILLFMSDNGGQALNNVRQGKANRDQNYPARAGKGSAFMGGVREPMMVCWPGVTEKNTTNDNPVMIEDFFPTILEMAGISGYTTSQTVDGKSFVHLLKNPDEKRERPILWHFPNLWGETQNKEEGYGAFSAYLKGNYHLIYHWENRKLRLYNIKEDISEQNDLSAQYPDIVKALAKEMTDELKRCKAQRPSLKTTGKRIAYPDGSL